MLTKIKGENQLSSNDWIATIKNDFKHIESQIDVILRENAFLIYHTLVMFGPLRPRDIQEYTGIATGRMYNEIANLQNVGLVVKEKKLTHQKAKSFYSANQENHLSLLNESSFSIDRKTQTDPSFHAAFELLSRYITRYSVLFQNFISKISSNLMTQHLMNADGTSGDYTTHQEILLLSEEDYQILRSRIQLMIRDLKVNTSQISEKYLHVAVNIGLFMYKPD